jgi:hypothetical protein
MDMYDIRLVLRPAVPTLSSEPVSDTVVDVMKCLRSTTRNTRERMTVSEFKRGRTEVTVQTGAKYFPSRLVPFLVHIVHSG